ncbi:MAG: flagellar filament capping protein FliD [Nitrospiraceae bacterium]|nr:MAG: flagellar filament capping protein FliD [Nitrospiraceae bacterium]
MSSFTVGGLATGIDYNDLISKLIEVKRRPIDILESKKSSYNEKMNSYSELSSKLASLKSAVNKLRLGATFYVRTATTSDETVVESTATGAASVGNYAITVTTLASAEKEVHNGTGLASPSDVVNSSGSDKVFQYTYDGTQRTLSVPEGTTLEGLKNLINDDIDNPGISATLVNDGSNERMVLTGNDTGSSKNITVDAGTTLDGSGGTSDFTAAAFTENKTAANADFTIDGLQISRETNSIADVISGVTITLKKEDSTANISVASDNEEIKKQIEEFVTAYNDVMSFIADNTAYDSTTKESGILSGEATVRNIQNSMRSAVSGSVSGLSGALSLLAEIGITTDYKTGNLEMNSTTLETELGSHLDDVADLFTDSSNGIAKQIYDYTGTITSSIDGSITLRKDGLQDVIKNISDTIRNMEFRLEKTEDDLVRKFTALESLVSNYTTIGNFLTNFSTRA